MGEMLQRSKHIVDTKGLKPVQKITVGCLFI